MSAERDLLLETAHRVFGRESADAWAEVEKSGLADLGEEAPLADVAEVIRASAYHGTEIDFAEKVMPEVGDAQRRGALMRSIQMLGALERVRDLTVTYAAERRQFGQALNRFQAVQQQLAELAGEVALAAAAVEAAVEDPLAPRQVATAKIVAGSAAGRAAAIAHQVHGAIGFTHEHQLHRWTTRLWAWRDEFGTESAWSEALGDLVARTGGDRLWELITGE
ncbi:MAG TPA: acyl-CoA dehydrogenase family protein [Candidatus Dormibacteraeota bacterium]